MAGKAKKDNSRALIEALSESKKARNTSGKIMSLPIMTDGLVVEELALELDRSVETVRERLKGLIAAGQVVVGRKETKDILGRPTWTPSYKFIDAK